jgi:hypothetical protein
VAEYVPGAAELLQRLANATPQALPDIFRSAALANAAAPEPFAVILDDYHVLEDDTISVLPGTELIFELLAKIAEYAHNCHLILASRMLPNLQGLARLTAQRRAVFFDYALLQWTAAEVQQLVEKSGGEMITRESAEQLAARMGGWVTGIVLALDQDVRSRDQPAIDLIADTNSVYAFFAEQIIAPLAPTVQRFLEDTSVLEDLSPARCNTLRDAHDSAVFLAEITRRGLFVSHKGGWVAYHSLFREFLRARLAQEPVRERTLLLSAAKLYSDEENLERVLECFLLAGAQDRAIALLRREIPRYRQRSRQNVLLACFERLSSFFEQAGKGRILPSDLLLAQVRVYNDLALWDRAELAIRLAETAGDQQIRIGEASGSGLVTVLLSAASSFMVTVNYATSDGSATAGSDYSAKSGTLTFAPSQTSQSTSITILDDTLAESSETINLTLSSPSNATLGTPNPATLTIVDDETPPPPQEEFYTYDAIGNMLSKTSVGS